MSFFEPGPRRRREPLIDAPRIVWIILALFAIVFVIQSAQWGLGERVWAVRFGVWPKRWTPEGEAILRAAGVDTGLLPGLASYVTYGFLHGDLTHLVVNTLWFLAFGTAVARRQAGSPGDGGLATAARFLPFFALCSIGAGGLHTLINWGSAAPLVGASGGIAGLMAATSRFIARPASAKLWSLSAPPVVGFAVAWTLINAMTALGALGAPELGLVSWEAHLGGYAVGLLLYPAFDRPQPRV